MSGAVNLPAWEMVQERRGCVLDRSYQSNIGAGRLAMWEGVIVVSFSDMPALGVIVRGGARWRGYRAV